MLTDEQDKVAHRLVHAWMEKITHDVDGMHGPTTTNPEMILAFGMLITSITAVCRLKYPEHEERLRNLFATAVEQGFDLGEDIQKGHIG